MHKPRIIPVLLIKDNKLFKSTKFENLKYIGDPINAIRIFNKKQIDEIIVIDICATKNNKKPNLDLIKKISNECYMPFAYGGGIKDVDIAREIIFAGAEKIIINNSVIVDDRIITNLSNNFGSQAVVVSVDIILDKTNNYKIFNYLTKSMLSLELKQYLKQIENLGAGEIFLNFVDNDGMMGGYDLFKINDIYEYISVPLMVCGGVGKITDFKNLLHKVPKISAMCAGSFFVYQGKLKSVLINAPSKKEIEAIYDL